MTDARHNNLREHDVAPLRNVALFSQLFERVRNVKAGRPVMGGFAGKSGLGKSTAARHAAARNSAIYIECGSTWREGMIVDSVASELMMPPLKGPIAKKINDIIGWLADDPVVLIFDEADHIVLKRNVDVVREISDKARAPVIFIGEENLPSKLMEFERAHNRILDWGDVVAANLDDAKKLLKVHVDNLVIADDLLQKIVNDTDGCARRIVMNFDRVEEFAKRHSLLSLDLRTYKELIYNGMPKRRAAPARTTA